MFDEKCQLDSVSENLLALINMILDGPNIKDRISNNETNSLPALSIAQLLIYNSARIVKMLDTTLTPVVVCIGLLIYAHTHEVEH